jgi:Mg2+-importing ATPase
MSDPNYSTSSIEAVYKELKTSQSGLPENEARNRLRLYGFNEPAKGKRIPVIIQILLKFGSPLIVLLLIIAGFSLFFGQKISALIVSLMAVVSVFLSFFQEYRAGREAQLLGEMVHTTATVIRRGKSREVKIREIVPGDIVELFAGDMIPADLRIISCKDLFINQASLTGESFPVEKFAGPVYTKPRSPSDLQNIAFMGSSVVSGTGLGVVIKTGIRTQFGELSKHLAAIDVETSFDRGIRKFTWLMIYAMLVMVMFIFAINAFRRGNVLESFLFSLGVAVGLTPEMLPVLVAVNLSRGAIKMSKKEVIVKRLNSIQNFGAMDILCTDKTGTLTLNHIILEKHCDVEGKESEDVLKFAYMNSFYQTGLRNLLDKTILNHEKFGLKGYKKLDEIPFDFLRKIMSVVIEFEGKHIIIAKGAPEEIFKRCTHYELEGKIYDMHQGLHANLKKEYDSLSREGFRVLAIAYKDADIKREFFSREDEKELTLKGYVAFLDPPKPTAKSAIQALKKLGIEVKVLTGDNELVTEKICREVGLDVAGLVSGDQIDKCSGKEFMDVVKTATIFARTSPEQKEKIIRALHDMGHTVGYLGDGINDAPALKASDVGITVNNAVDIAKESADIILLRKSLMVLSDGVIEGRKTFGNIVKYIKMGSSSNFGNMFSMTGGSMFLPFLPMLPIQILLNNFLYDMSQLAIPTDDVDMEYIAKPRPWNINSIKRFMVLIGPISSIFDFVTFGVMLLIFRASADLFHTGWFVESLVSQTLIIYVIRTSKIPFIGSLPSRALIFTSLLIAAIGIYLPFSPLAGALGFVGLPGLYFAVLTAIVITYMLMVQLVKSWFVRKYGFD